MLLQLPNLRLLLSSATKPLFPLRSRPFFSVSAASRRRPRDPAPRRVSPQRRRRSGAATEEKMEFNRNRAAGRDGGGKRNLQLKVRKLNPINTICYVQILGTGMDTQDTSPSVLLFFDKQRIIFNAGEGLQRFCTEHKIKLSKVDHMLLTRVCSETAGGLPGLLLTLAGIGDEGMSINVWGPSDLKYLVDAMRSFIPNSAMVHTHSFGEITSSDIAITSNHDLPKSLDPIVLVDDEVVRISAIPLHPRYSGISMGNSFSLKPGDIAVIYACELPEIKGKFDPAKASALGLRPGPKYRELQLGNSVASDDQSTMIHPSDVLGPSIPGPIVVIVDCPTPSHLLELLSFQSLNCYYEKSENNSESGTKSVNCIIHLSPASVTNDTDYQNWMKRFGDVQHIMAGHERNNIQPPVLSSSERITTRLNHVCPHLFPSPGFCSREIKNSEGLGSSREDPPSVHHGIIPAENLLKFQLRPYSQLGLDRSFIPSLKMPVDIVSELLAEIPEIEDASEAVCKLWHKRAKGMGSASDEHMIIMEEPWILENASTPNLENESDVPCCLENISREDMEIILLGTGSSQPSKYRNVSSIYINLFSKGSVLLDCGEGTLGQLKRRFGLDGADEAVRTLRLIWISHIHADHHTGLARILALRNELLKDVRHDPIIVVGPRPLKRFLDAYSRLEDLDMEFLDCKHTTEVSWNSFMDLIRSSENDSEGLDVKDTESMAQKKARRSLGDTIFSKCSQMQSFWKQQGTPIDAAVVLPILIRLQKVLNAAGLTDLYSVPVVHCPQAFGVVLKASERMNSVGKKIPGWKLVYSGDTRPCQALVDASRDATVLIHEATFEDGMEADALAKNHSTTMEAVKVGTSADVYRIILTHFSQRYPKIPVFDETHMSNTCIAFDMMSINLADLPILPKVLPYLKLLFRNEMTLDDGDEAPAIAVQQ